MPTSGIRIVNETNLTTSLYPALKGEAVQYIDNFDDIPVTIANVMIMENIEPKGKTFVNLDTKNWQGGYTTVVTEAPTTLLNNANNTNSNVAVQDTPVFAEIQPNRAANNGAANKRASGGRRSMIKQEELSPEEEERLRIRRERNKLAAARCRKRRVDQTESLQKQVDEHEEKKRQLQEEIQNLQAQRDELQFILEAHRETCNLPIPSTTTTTHNHSHHHNRATTSPFTAHRSTPHSNTNTNNNTTTLVELNVPKPPKVIVKSENPELDSYQVLYTNESILSDLPDSPSTTSTTTSSSIETDGPSPAKKPNRPASLMLPVKAHSLRTIEGIPIETPTNILSSLNFDALMEGRTGLTPTNVLTPVSITMSSLQTPVNVVSSTPTCATQQRGLTGELASPDNPKLVSL